MVEAEDKLETAPRELNSRDRDQRRRIAWLAMTTASYAVDTLFLALFAFVGTISGTIAPAYGAAAAAMSAETYAATASGWNLKRSDPSLVEPLTFLGILMQLGVALAAPQIAFPFLANLFTVPSISPEVSITMSAGIASHRKGETIEQLLHRVDLALYQAKEAGRNTVIASPS